MLASMANPHSSGSSSSAPSLPQKGDVIEEMLDTALASPPPAATTPLAHKPRCFCPPPKHCFCRHASKKAATVLFPKMPKIQKRLAMPPLNAVTGMPPMMMPPVIEKAHTTRMQRQQKATKRLFVKERMEKTTLRSAIGAAKKSLEVKQEDREDEAELLSQATQKAQMKAPTSEEAVVQDDIQQELQQEVRDETQRPRLMQAQNEANQELQVEQNALETDGALDGMDRLDTPIVTSVTRDAVLPLPSSVNNDDDLNDS